jgi:hypothetical protein
MYAIYSFLILYKSPGLFASELNPLYVIPTVEITIRIWRQPRALYKTFHLSIIQPFKTHTPSQENQLALYITLFSSSRRIRIASPFGGRQPTESKTPGYPGVV